MDIFDSPPPSWPLLLNKAYVIKWSFGKPAPSPSTVHVVYGCPLGALVQTSPMICGGYYDIGKPTKDCIVIGEPKNEMKMILKRYNAASVVLNHDTLWIVGGQDENNTQLRSTEFVKRGHPSVKGPDLPFTICNHSMIKFDKKSIYLIGGNQGTVFESLDILANRLLAITVFGSSGFLDIFLRISFCLDFTDS